MKIQTITHQHGNDFTATLICDSCGTTATLKDGYHDAHFHNAVIPNINCPTCDRNHYGESTEFGATRRAREHVNPCHLTNIKEYEHPGRAEFREDDGFNYAGNERRVSDKPRGAYAKRSQKSA